jgi:putative transposase
MIGAVLSTLTSRLVRRLNGLAQQIVEAFPFDSSPKYLLRDRDRIYGLEFRKQVDAMGIQEVLSAPRSPWQRAYVERVIGSIRRECLDHMIVLDEGSLRRTLRSYFRYYNRASYCPTLLCV